MKCNGSTLRGFKDMNTLSEFLLQVLMEPMMLRITNMINSRCLASRVRETLDGNESYKPAYPQLNFKMLSSLLGWVQFN